MHHGPFSVPQRRTMSTRHPLALHRSDEQNFLISHSNSFFFLLIHPCLRRSLINSSPCLKKWKVSLKLDSIPFVRHSVQLFTLWKNSYCIRQKRLKGEDISYKMITVLNFNLKVVFHKGPDHLFWNWKSNSLWPWLQSYIWLNPNLWCNCTMACKATRRLKTFLCELKIMLCIKARHQKLRKLEAPCVHVPNFF